MRLQYKYFPVKFAKPFKTYFLEEMLTATASGCFINRYFSVFRKIHRKTSLMQPPLTYYEKSGIYRTSLVAASDHHRETNSVGY